MIEYTWIIYNNKLIFDIMQIPNLIHNGNRNIDLNIQVALAKESAREQTWRVGPTTTAESVTTKGRGDGKSFRYAKAPSQSTKVATPQSNNLGGSALQSQNRIRGQYVRRTSRQAEYTSQKDEGLKYADISQKSPTSRLHTGNAGLMHAG